MRAARPPRPSESPAPLADRLLHRFVRPSTVTRLAQRADPRPGSRRRGGPRSSARRAHRARARAPGFAAAAVRLPQVRRLPQSPCVPPAARVVLKRGRPAQQAARQRTNQEKLCINKGNAKGARRSTRQNVSFARQLLPLRSPWPQPCEVRPGRTRARARFTPCVPEKNVLTQALTSSRARHSALPAARQDRPGARRLLPGGRPWSA